VVGCEAALHLIDRVAGFASRKQRKAAEIGQRAADENDGLRRKNVWIIQNFVWSVQVSERSRGRHQERAPSVTIGASRRADAQTGRQADAGSRGGEWRRRRSAPCVSGPGFRRTAARKMSRRNISR
ncbi:hypothetical protein, partial [Burkholderia cenocepacia]|uniref:hypothetical protein n=1 Tax=Burkholderia cenocepacia TaxID=95486 RepID=UPI0019553F9B